MLPRPTPEPLVPDGPFPAGHERPFHLTTTRTFEGWLHADNGRLTFHVARTDVDDIVTQSLFLLREDRVPMFSRPTRQCGLTGGKCRYLCEEINRHSSFDERSDLSVSQDLGYQLGAGVRLSVPLPRFEYCFHKTTTCCLATILGANEKVQASKAREALHVRQCHNQGPYSADQSEVAS